MNGWLQQQHRHYMRRSSTETSKTRFNRLWLCGIGAGIALALGLKSIYYSDGGNGFCDADVSDEKKRRSGRYHQAVGVSRDLVQRIKVGFKVLHVFCFPLSLHIRVLKEGAARTVFLKWG